MNGGFEVFHASNVGFLEFVVTQKVQGGIFERSMGLK